MSPLNSALLLSVCVGACVMTSASDPEGQRTAPDALPNGDVCKDCTQIFELLSDLLSNQDLQKKMINGIENLCSHMPGTVGKICKDEVEKMFPVAVTFLTTMVKPSDICKAVGLCKGCGKQEKMLHYFGNEASPENQESEKVQSAKECNFCVMVIKTLESFLPKERTEEAVVNLLEEICNFLPQSYQGQCQALVGKFSRTVMDAILSYTTPHTICVLLQMCKGQEAPPLDPCTLPTYRCRDVRTAVKCGTLFYCQKFAWKPDNTV